MKRLTYLILLVAVLTSCKDANKELYKKVMETHDEVMPRMGELERLKREIRNEIAQSPDMIVERKEKLEQIISNLDSASYAMMDWMHKFNPLPDSARKEDVQRYLETEQERIQRVKDKMLKSIEDAKTALAENK